MKSVGGVQLGRAKRAMLERNLKTKIKPQPEEISVKIIWSAT